MECYPDTPITNIVSYINEWPGVAGKLSETNLISVKHSAQSSFIRSIHERVKNESKFSSMIQSTSIKDIDLQHSLLNKKGFSSQ